MIVEWDDFNRVMRAVSCGVVVDSVSAPVDEDFITIGSGGTGDECWPRSWHSGSEVLAIYLFPFV